LNSISALDSFDPTLLKYKPRTLGKTATEITAVALFERYAQAMKRDKALTRNGFQKYTALLSHLKAFFGDVGAESVGDRRAGDFSAYLLERMFGQTAKQYLFLLRACWDWAAGKYHVTGNPWADSVGKVKSQPSKRVKLFSEGELRTILSGFESSKVYRYYYPVVLFMVSTGVRPGEAFGLKWGSVGSVLESVGVAYRSPYAIRHSAATLALENGANPTALAKQLGHDPRVLFKNYDHAIRKQSLFVEF
jgi:integrase